ncbi:MAG: hypothetical protein ACLTYW_01675 [Collinsella sp.]
MHIIAPSVFFARCAALDEARKNDAETFDNLATACPRGAYLQARTGRGVRSRLMGEASLRLPTPPRLPDRRRCRSAAEDYPAAFAALAASCAHRPFL